MHLPSPWSPLVSARKPGPPLEVRPSLSPRQDLKSFRPSYGYSLRFRFKFGKVLFFVVVAVF